MQVAQFTRDGFMFARLRPYEQWEALVSEALRLWQMFVDIGKPAEIQRLGIRFINRISLPPSQVLIEDYLDPAPKGARDLDLPFRYFFHQDIFDVAGHPYAIRLIRTTQPETEPNPQAFGILLDIDVFTTQPFEPELKLLDRRLTEMRWLKNRMFFGSVTAKALEAFG